MINKGLKMCQVLLCTAVNLSRWLKIHLSDLKRLKQYFCNNNVSNDMIKTENAFKMKNTDIFKIQNNNNRQSYLI